MQATISVLDHGSVTLIEHWGSDERIIEAARMSSQRGFEDWGNDYRLLVYLWRHKHMTPFEMCGAVLEVKAPIFVFREWHRHRTFSYNEMSARYAPLPNENYEPSEERLFRTVDHTNKQAGKLAGSLELSPENALRFKKELHAVYTAAQALYEDALLAGVPKELARLVLPVGRYSCMRASANLRNWLQFLSLRLDKNAQWEIQEYARAVYSILARLFPRTMGLFSEGEFQ